MVAILSISMSYFLIFMVWQNRPSDTLCVSEWRLSSWRRSTSDRSDSWFHSETSKICVFQGFAILGMQGLCKKLKGNKTNQRQIWHNNSVTQGNHSLWIQETTRWGKPPERNKFLNKLKLPPAMMVAAHCHVDGVFSEEPPSVYVPVRLLNRSNTTRPH